MKFITVPQAAKMLAVHKQTLYRLVKEGRVPSIRVGRSVRISEDHLMRMVLGVNGGSNDPVYPCHDKEGSADGH